MVLSLLKILNVEQYFRDAILSSYWLPHQQSNVLIVVCFIAARISVF